MATRPAKLLPLLFLLVLTVACYLAGISGHFNLDDSVNIRLNRSLHIESLSLQTLWQAATSGGAGPLGRPISTLSFALNFFFSGLNPIYFKATNLAIHVANGMLIYLLSQLLLGLHLRGHNGEDEQRASLVGLAAAAMWLLHPFNLTGVLYVVQRMTSLSAFFTLAALLAYVFGRKKLIAGNNSGSYWIGTALFIFTPIATLCKESGALTPLLIFVTEAALLRWAVPKREWRRKLVILVGLCAIAPVAIGLLYLIRHPSLLVDGYSWRDFTLTERLMTEARVLWFYLHMTILPSLSEMGLHHDDIPISRELLSPWTTLPAIAGLVALTAGAFVLRNKHPLITFGIVFFFVAHALESTIIPLEIAFEHRNYLPMFGIFVPLAYYVLLPSLHPSSLRLRRIALSLLIVLFAGLTALRAHEWGNPFLSRTLEATRHPYSVRAHTDLAALYSYIPPTSPEEAFELYSKALFHYQRAADIAPSSLAGLLGILMANAQRGIPPQEDFLHALEYRLARVPFGPPNKNSLIGLARSIGREEYVINAEVVERLYRSALSNPKLTGDHRGQIISEFAKLPPEIRPKTKQGA